MDLEIRNLSVGVNDREILKNFNLHIKKGEIHAIMGPNGTGKSTLSRVILGDKRYDTKNGDIIVDGKNIQKLETDERARMGIFLCYQNPISIDGVTTSELIKASVDTKGEYQGLYKYVLELETNTDKLDMDKEGSIG